MDPGKDLALLQLKTQGPAAGVEAVALCSSSPSVGEEVALVVPSGGGEGPQGYTLAVRRAEEVRSLLQAGAGADATLLAALAPDSTWIETNVPVMREQSGCPLVNVRGEAVGMCVGIGQEGSASSFALAASEIRTLLEGAGGDCRPLATLVTRAPQPQAPPPQAPPQITLPSGKVFRQVDYKTDLDSAIALVDAWANDDPAVVQVKHGSLFSVGYARHLDGTLNGVAILFYDPENPKQYVTYAGNQRHGPLKVWDEKGRNLYWSQWSDNKRDGISCLFSEDQPWMVCESSQDEFVGIALVSADRQVKQFTSESEAATDAFALEALNAIVEIENEIKNIHLSLRRNVEREAGREAEERKQLAAAMHNARARARINSKISQRAADRTAVIGALRRKSGM